MKSITKTDEEGQLMEIIPNPNDSALRSVPDDNLSTVEQVILKLQTGIHPAE